MLELAVGRVTVIHPAYNSQMSRITMTISTMAPLPM